MGGSALQEGERGSSFRRVLGATGSWAVTLLRQSAAWIVLLNVGVFVAFGLANERFLSNAALTAVMASAGAIIIITVGQALVLGIGQLDISVGANVILSSVIGAKVMVSFAEIGEAVGSAGVYSEPGLAIGLGVAASLVSGVAFGVINGVLVSYLKVSAFVVTLGTSGLGLGFAYVLTNGTNIHQFPRAISSGFGNLKLVGILPAHAVLAIVLTVIVWILVNRTRFGLRILATGSNRSAADRAGVPTRRYVVVVFAIMGLFCGIAGLIDIARFTTTNIEGHGTDGLSSIAGAVIGGTSLFGGVVSITGAYFGGLFAVLLTIGFIVLGIAPFYNMMATGAVLIAAVVLDQWRRRPRIEKERDGDEPEGDGSARATSETPASASVPLKPPSTP
jgi:ribose transport system permease protein